MPGLKSDAYDRRDFIKLSAAAGLALTVPSIGGAQLPRMATRPILVTGEQLPVIGLGMSDEFETMPTDDGALLRRVIMTLVEQGGRLVDTAPGYGDSERVLGRYLSEWDLSDTLFVSTKVKTTGVQRGLESLARSQKLLRKHPLDLMLVHSLEDVLTQLQNLRDWQEAGNVRLIGVTTANSMGYDFIEELVNAGRCDVIQMDYSVVSTLAEERLIPAAAEHGVAVIINSAFGNGGYFSRLRGRELPPWASEFGCDSWAQFSLKYILGNPGVTCVLTATSNPEHMLDNAGAGIGPLPDEQTRRRMAAHLRDI